MNVYPVTYRRESQTVQKIILFGLEVHTHPTPTHPKGRMQERESARKWRMATKPSPLYFHEVTIFKINFHSFSTQLLASVIYFLYLGKANATLKN